MNFLYSLTVGVLFGIGIYQILRRDLIRVTMGFTMLFTAVNLFLFSTGAFDGVLSPYVDRVAEGTVQDPLVQALILTAIVVGFATFSVFLIFVQVVAKRYDTIDSDDLDKLQQ